MVDVSKSRRIAKDIEEADINHAEHNSEAAQQQQLQNYDNYDSQFMPRPPTHNARSSNAFNSQPSKQKQSKVLSASVVEKALQQIYTFYAQLYARQIKQYQSFNISSRDNLKIQSFILFTKNFHILKAIFTIERVVQLFKKHANYGKLLTLDNFYFLINSMSHEPEAKDYFGLQSMTSNQNAETIEQIEKQEFYNYLQLDSPQKYRQNFTDLFGAFNCLSKPRTDVVKYNYRKFSLPELRKKAIPEPKEGKKREKDLFILKNDNQVEKNIFDEAKSIVVSWDSLRSKSVSNLGKPSEKVQKRFLKMDPEDDPYLTEMRGDSRTSPKNRYYKKEMGNIQSSRVPKTSIIEQKIKEIEERQNIKNQQILNRIDKKLQAKPNRKLNI